MRPDREMLLAFFFVMSICSIVANSIGMFVGNLTVRFKMMVFFLPMFIAPAMILGGYLLVTSKLQTHQIFKFFIF